MRWRHAILPVTTACGAMLCVVAILAFGPAAYAQGPGIKPGDSKPANKPDDKKPGDGKATDAKDAPKDSDIHWTADGKLDWGNFKGGKPTDPKEHATTYANMVPVWSCDPDTGKYTHDVNAQFSQKLS